MKGMLLAAGALAAATLSAPASACDGAEKTPRFLTEGPLPANAVGVLWWNGRWSDAIDCGTESTCILRKPEPSQWRIERLSDEGAAGEEGAGGAGGGDATEVPHRVEPMFTTTTPQGAVRTDAFLIAARDGLAPGRYRFHGPGDTRDVVVEVKDAALASAAATMKVGDLAPGPVRGGFGGPSGEAVVRGASLSLPAEAAPFEGALAYETTIDGRRWREMSKPCEYAPPHAPHAGRGRERITMPCAAGPGDAVEPGKKHRVQMRAFLPGTEVAFAADAEVELVCAGSETSTPTTSTSSGCGSCTQRASGKLRGWWLLPLGALLWRRRAARRPPPGRGARRAL